jgi:hypothetical protein
MRAKIVDIKTRKVVFQKTLVDRLEFAALADKIKALVHTKAASDLLTEMKFCACFNREFRNETYPELEDLYENLRRELGVK